MTIDVVEIPEGFDAEDGFIQTAMVEPGTSKVVAGLVNFGGEDRGVLQVLESAWSIDFDEKLFDDSDGLVILPAAACPV